MRMNLKSWFLVLLNEKVESVKCHQNQEDKTKFKRNVLGHQKDVSHNTICDYMRVRPAKFNSGISK